VLHDPLSSPRPAPDAALIADSLARPDAFAGVFDRHWPAIHRYCASRAGPAFRRGRRRVALPFSRDPDFAEDALGRVVAAALGPELAAALAEVAAVDRDALLLHAWAELTYAEIATAAGVPIGTVRSRIHRARTHLRNHLDSHR
jgi:RNA polymerase sigma-70 factor (ECF subfamily)